MPKVIQVIESSDKRGRGVEGDPIRLVAQYHTLEGDLLAEKDSWILSEKEELDRQREQVKDLHKFFIGVRDLTNRAMSGDRTVSSDPTPPQVFIDVRELLTELADFRNARALRKYDPTESGPPESDRN